MNPNTLLAKVIMPSQLVFETKASMVNIPGGDGVFGVLPGHAKLVSTIKTGVVSIFSGNQSHLKEKQFFVYAGIAQITGTGVNIVSEFAADLAEQKRADIMDKIAGLKAELDASSDDKIKINILTNNINRYNSLLEFVTV